ncbi:hypothetical protein RIF29_37771 [Crotalaria pallida]|uniref:FAF domain-containing protein n=1 Tax=Crotalaria pallida TaxID=3830 RepID=A0AAN9DXV8_CROPI
MSSSSSCFYQGLHSCLEPHVLILKLAQPHESLTNHECDKKDTISSIEGSSWSFFLQSLSNTSHCNKTEDPYVHPTVKRSTSMLSEKSLEMCTESLGSETGSNASETSDDISLLLLESNNTCFTNNTNSNVSKRVNNRACKFPPPLTSINDFGVIRPYRENGRLILEAVTSPSPRPYFHAYRSDGRLTLRFFESFTGYECDDDEDEDEEVEDYEAEPENQEEECVENVEDEMDMRKYGRPRRCKESGNRVRDIFGDGYFELPTLSICLSRVVSSVGRT